MKSLPQPVVVARWLPTAVVEEAADIAHHRRRRGEADRGIAQLQLVHQVLPAVARHDIEQHHAPPDDSGFPAGVARAGDDDITGRHQRGDLIGVAERDHRRVVTGNARPTVPPRLSLVPLTASTHHPSSANARATSSRGPNPHAPDMRSTQGTSSGICSDARASASAGGRVEVGPHRGLHHGDPGVGVIAAHRCRRQFRGDEEQVRPLMGPHPVGERIRHEDHRGQVGPLVLEVDRGGRPGGKDRDDQVRSVALNLLRRVWATWP